MWMSSRATYASVTPLTVAPGDVLAAGLAGAILSGVPSTTVTLFKRESLLDGAAAAGTILLRGERRTLPLLAAAVPQGRQWADHVAYGLTVGVVVRRRRLRRGAP